MNRTSITHPIAIAELRAAPSQGRIGITFCPGKKQSGASSGSWNRDLALDLDAFRDWNASAVVTLLEEHELDRLKVPDLGEEVRRRHMEWYHLPIVDISVPCSRFEAEWRSAGAELRARLRRGFDIIVH